MLLPFVFCGGSAAAQIVSTGSAVIEKGDLRTAYSNALNNAVLGAVRNYYNSSENPGSEAPDISQEYAKFVKSYLITERKITGFTVSVTLTAEVDSSGLQNAALLINKPVNTAVFVYGGIPADVLSEEEQSRIIDSALASKNFSTAEQKNFLYSITDTSDAAQVSVRFENVYSRYLFRFDFKHVSSGAVKDPDNGCELTTITDIIYRDGGSKVLKIETGSLKSNEKQCVSEAVTKAVATTLDYIRNNIIKTPDADKEIYAYSVKAVNFTNMVGPNNFMKALKERGLINTYKAVSFSPKEILFQVDGYFTEDELKNKLSGVTSDDMNFTFFNEGNSIVLDFTPVENIVRELPEQYSEPVLNR